MTRVDGAPARSFEAFLSHRYKSPEVNQFFFNLFEPLAEVQFRVDSGEFPINVTRLERQIRAADAFVGIYPFPGGAGDAGPPSREDLLKASRYFRLELDLATRSNRPAIVFVDKAYGPQFPIPPSVMRCEFDSREILGKGGSPNAPSFTLRFKEFLSMVASDMQSRHVFDRRATTSNLVGILLPAGGSSSGYATKERALIRGLIEEHNFRTIEIDWTSRLDATTLARLDPLDLVVTDVGDWPSGRGLVPYLHGRFLPMIRLRRVKQDGQPLGVLASTLFGGLDVGYVEDIVAWSDAAALRDDLKYRLHTLTLPSRRIDTSAEARDYFLSASRRNEGIFLSYSGHDAEVARGISLALQRRFLRVFDYKDGMSIRPGQPWMDEIYGSLAESSIGVPLLSPTYLESGHCMKEARFMVDRATDGKMRILPILVQQSDSIPKWLSDHQYLEFSRLGGPADVIPLVEQSLGKAQ